LDTNDPASSLASFWAAARERMILDTTIVNLNTGSFGPLPKPIFERATTLRQMLAAEPTHFFVRQLPPLLWNARERLAAYLGTVPTQARVHHQRLGGDQPGCFWTGALDARRGAAHRPRIRSDALVLGTAARRQGLTLRTFPLPTMTASPQAIVEAATRAMTPRTRLFFFQPCVVADRLGAAGSRIVFRSPATRDHYRRGRGPRAGDDPTRRLEGGGRLLHRQLSQVDARADGGRVPGDWIR